MIRPSARFRAVRETRSAALERAEVAEPQASPWRRWRAPRRKRNVTALRRRFLPGRDVGEGVPLQWASANARRRGPGAGQPAATSSNSDGAGVAVRVDAGVRAPAAGGTEPRRQRPASGLDSRKGPRPRLGRRPASRSETLPSSARSVNVASIASVTPVGCPFVKRRCPTSPGQHRHVRQAPERNPPEWLKRTGRHVSPMSIPSPLVEGRLLGVAGRAINACGVRIAANAAGGRSRRPPDRPARGRTHPPCQVDDMELAPPRRACASGSRTNFATSGRRPARAGSHGWGRGHSRRSVSWWTSSRAAGSTCGGRTPPS